MGMRGACAVDGEECHGGTDQQTDLWEAKLGKIQSFSGTIVCY